MEIRTKEVRTHLMQSMSRVPQSQMAWPTEPTQSPHSSLSTEPGQ